MTDGADRSWTYELKRDDLGTSRVVETSLDALADGEVRLKVSRVGLTANNVTYAVLGEAFDYWEFFPAADGWGIVPLWGSPTWSNRPSPGLTSGRGSTGTIRPQVISLCGPGVSTRADSATRASIART